MKTAITYDTIMQKYEEATEESINRNTIRETYLKPLEQKGLIDFIDDPRDKRKKNINHKLIQFRHVRPFASPRERLE